MAPSSKHIELQHMLYRWMDNRCIKMAALTECNIVGYIADFVAIARMNDSEHEKYCRHSNLKPLTMHDQWQGKGLPLKRVFEGDIDRHYVNVFEVKVSRNDFLNTFGSKDSPHAKARMEPVGTAHWVVAGKSVCVAEELPDFWGLLEPYGAGLTEKKMPKLNILPDSMIHSFAFDMLWLQMNYRGSYYDQLHNMADAVKDIQVAIRMNKPIGEIARRTRIAVDGCKGFGEAEEKGITVKELEKGQGSLFE
jgi:hypothetical protein